MAILLATHLSNRNPFASLRTTHLFMTAAENARKPKILCLHGKFQNASTFSNKIAGARRKIARGYDMLFIDGPIVLEDGYKGDPVNKDNPPRAWWLRSEDGSHIFVRDALVHAIGQCNREEIDVILGFSQGGTLATALASSGAFPNLKCVITAGAPYVADAFDEAAKLAEEYQNDKSTSLYELGLGIPKFHMAGENDALVAVESTESLCEKGGSGTFVVHEQGHLFPTRALRVQQVLDFLANHVN